MTGMQAPGYSSAAVQAGDARVSLAGEGARAPVARSIAETLALLYEFGIDDVADVKMAVDEACSQLESAAAGVSAVRIDVRRHVMTVTASAEVESPGGIEKSGFGWHVLRTLTDRADLDVAQDEGGAGTISITFDKAAHAVA